jgi:hypothetical protein
MRNLKTIVNICAIIFTTSLHAQQLSTRDKTIKVEDYPEYVIVNCDNAGSMLGNSIRIAVQAKNSSFEQSLKALQDILEDKNGLNLGNQTDLLNAMSKLGFDYVNAFPENSIGGSSFSRTGFVFRKKQEYRN